MTKITQILFLLLVFYNANICRGQHYWEDSDPQFYIGTGYGTAFFKKYVNQLGENTLDQSFSRPQNMKLESGIRLKVLNEKFRWNIGANYAKHEINTAFTSTNGKIPIVYSLSYLSIITGVNYTFLNWNELKFQIHSHFSYDFLTYGSYRYNNVFADLSKSTDFDKTIVSYHWGASMEYPLTEEISAYINYNVSTGLKEKNKDSRPGEKHALKTNSLSIGLIFTIIE